MLRCKHHLTNQICANLLLESDSLHVWRMGIGSMGNRIFRVFFLYIRTSSELFIRILLTCVLQTILYGGEVAPTQ